MTLWLGLEQKELIDIELRGVAWLGLGMRTCGEYNN